MRQIINITFFIVLFFTLSCSFMSSPQVLSISPQAGENILTSNLTITLKFSKDMDKNSTEEAFSLYLSQDRGKTIKGDFIWTGDSLLTFTPLFSSLDYPAEYVIQLQVSALDIDGNGLNNKAYSTFSLLSNLARPIVSSTYPVNGSTNFSIYSNIIINFNLNMSTNETRDAFSINPDLPGTINIFSNQLIFSPESPFQNGSYYTVNLRSSAQATNSVSLLKSIEFYFLPGQNFTVPVLSAFRTNLNTFNMTNYQQNIEKYSTNLTLIFNTEMDKASLNKGLKFDPTLNFYINWISNNIAEINLMETMLPSTNYKLTIDSSVKSLYGRSFPDKTNIIFTTDGPLSRLSRYISTKEGSNSNWYPEIINKLNIGATNSISLTVTFSSLFGMDWISVFNNSTIQYISGENGLKQGQISDIIPLDSTTNVFLFVIDNLAISNIYKLSFKGGINGIQDILQNNLEKNIDLYFTTTN